MKELLLHQPDVQSTGMLAAPDHSCGLFSQRSPRHRGMIETPHKNKEKYEEEKERKGSERDFISVRAGKTDNSDNQLKLATQVGF